MDRIGKWALRIAATIVAVFAVNTFIAWYIGATTAQQDHLRALAWFILKIGVIGSITFCIGLLLALGFWASRAPKLDDRTRKEVHNATED